MSTGQGSGRGFTYIAVLILVAVMGVGLTAVAEVWHLQLKREREAELLFAGDQFRSAIAMYYANAPAAAGRYPMALEDLLKDPRYPGIKRYLRKIYVDPMTGGTNWQMVKGPNGEIVGVYSASSDEPVKKGNFRPPYQDFEGKTKYSDWVFVVSSKLLPTPPGGPAPGIQAPGAGLPVSGSFKGNLPAAAAPGTRAPGRNR